MIGIQIKPTIGIGDQLQFSSTPENYFKATGEKLLDVSRPWFFDHNPYVIRDDSAKPDRVQEMWNFSPTQYEFSHPRPGRPQVYLSNAEIWAGVFDVPVVLNRPRLYRFEAFPYERRENILLHTSGRSHGEMPFHIVEHVVKKYGETKRLFHIGPLNPDWNLQGVVPLHTPTLWHLAHLIAESRMLIGMDSAPSWIAACYPDVVIKKVRTKPSPEHFEKWIPLEIGNIHSHWDSREHQVFNVTERDIGFTTSYLKI